METGATSKTKIVFHFYLHLAPFPLLHLLVIPFLLFSFFPFTYLTLLLFFKMLAREVVTSGPESVKYKMLAREVVTSGPESVKYKITGTAFEEAYISEWSICTEGTTQLLN
jgi:hypothetical protein